MPPRLLDTNVLIRYFTRDDPAKGERALALLLRVEQGQAKLATTATVIFETVSRSSTLTSSRATASAP